MNMALNEQSYIDNYIRFLALQRLGEDTKHLEEYINLFEKYSEYDESINIKKLKQKAVEDFVLEFGVELSEFNRIDDEDTIVVQDTDIFKRRDSAKPLDSVSTHPHGTVSTFERIIDDFETLCSAIEIIYRPGMGSHCMSPGSGPLVLTKVQKKIAAFLIDLFFSKKQPVRVMILKSRQMGFTTVLLAFWFWICIQIPGFACMFIIDKGAHLEEKRQLILNWVEQLSNISSKFPRVKRKSSKVIELTNGAKVLFESAEAPNPGTSEMIQGLHMSERPKWPEGRSRQVKASIVPAVPEFKNTFVIDESTAEGIDDFKEDWDRLHREGVYDYAETPIYPIFIPWFMSEEYMKKPPDKCYHNGRFVFMNDDYEVAELDAEGNISMNEEQYAREYNLSDSQIYWRRIKIKDAFRGDKILFDQEFPTTPDHAWAAVGVMFFNRQLLKLIEEGIHEPIFIGNIEDKNVANFSMTRLPDFGFFSPSLVKDNYGMLHIFEHPDTAKSYYIGADVSEGKIVMSSSKQEGDFSVISVIDDLGRDVAILRGHIKPEELAYYLILVGVYYNNARVNCERNKDGATVWSYFNPTGYPNVYYRDNSHGRVSDNAWSLITRGQRNPTLNILRATVREDTTRIKSRLIYNEMNTLVRKKDGKLEPSYGHHDDCLMARAHAETSRSGYEGYMRDIVEDEPEEVVAWNDVDNIFKFNGIEVW